MSIEVLSQTKDRLRFALREVDVSMANALRRIMLAEVPTWSVETVHFHENSSIYQNEYLAHRLGLIPLRVTDNSLETATLTLEVRHTEEAESVTSHDLRCETPGVEVVHGSEQGVLLAKLMPEQALKLEATICRGTGAEHAKWSPVSVAKFSYEADITVAPACAGAAELAERCPRRVFDVEESGQLVAARPADCIFCGECTNRDAKRLTGGRSITVNPVPRTFIFDVETVGQYDAVEVVDQALRILIQKCEGLAQKVQQLPSPPGTPPGTPMELAYQE